jgi:hypothetical protein
MKDFIFFIYCLKKEEFYTETNVQIQEINKLPLGSSKLTKVAPLFTAFSRNLRFLFLIA